jgi:hypothetical protein
MDGYIWLYRECYGENLLGRLERNWQWRQKTSRLRPQKAFVGARLAARALRGDAELRGMYKDGIRMMLHRHLRADPGQLLITLDAYDFSRFMERFKTRDYERHAILFEDPTQQTGTVQWENQGAKRRSASA